MRQLQISFVFILSALVCNAQSNQNEHPDSMMARLNQLPPDSNRVYLMEKIAIAYSQTEPEKGLATAFEAYKLARQLKLKKREAACLSIIGINYAAASNFEKGIEYNKAALKIYESLNDKKGIAAVSSNLSVNYLSTGKYTEALECNFIALEIYENIQEYRNTGVVLDNIAGIYYELKDYPASIRYYEKALTNYYKAEQEADVARCMGNMSRVYMDTGDFKTALKLLNQALDINTKTQNQVSILINLTNIGLVYSRQNDHANAISYLNQSLKMSTEFSLVNFIAINKGNIGSSYLTAFRNSEKKEMSLLDSATRYLEEAVLICDSIHFPAPKAEFLTDLANAHALSGNYEKAYIFLLEKNEVNDSIHSTESKAALAKLENKREIDLKNKDLIIKNRELEILELNSQRLTLLYSLIIVILTVVLLIIARYLRQKQKKYTKFVAHVNQVQSHEVRGPVATILGLIHVLKNKKHTDKEKEYIIDGIEEMALKLNSTVTDITANSGADQ